MTKEQAIQKLLVWAQRQLGYHEGANNYNQYAPKWTQAGGWNVQNQPWCDVFVDVGFIECFGLQAAARMTYQPAGGFSAGCAVSADYYRRHGAFKTQAEPGDQIFFYSGGGINHTGIVVRVYGGSIVTIEGNSSDMVAERVYQSGDSKIAGYGRPDWSVVAEMEADGDKENSSSGDEREIELCTAEIPTLRNGDCGAAAAGLQAMLRHLGYDPTWIDGEFGEKTETCVRAFQTDHALAADGVCGKETWKALMRQ